jgi:hypothetical protein
MNATLRYGFFLACLGATALAAEPEVRVAASRGLSVAVVDPSRPTPAREAMHQAFATSLGVAMSQRCGDSIGVRVKAVSADHAAFNLGAGVFDAVLVIGRDVPEALRHVDGVTFSATPDSVRHDRALHLIVGNGDASLQSLLAASFTGAVADQKFLDCFNGGGKIAAVVSGAKGALADASSH